MFNRYLSAALYESLPLLYAVIAVVVALLPLSPIRWVGVFALTAASGLTLQRRRAYRRRRK